MPAPPEDPADLAADLATVRHDLGKYVALNLRWLPDDPGDEELRAALALDLRATRSVPGASEDAPALWARLRPALARHRLDLSAVDASVAAIAAALPDLDRLDRPAMLALAQRALEIGPMLRRLR